MAPVGATHVLPPVADVRTIDRSRGLHEHQRARVEHLRQRVRVVGRVGGILGERAEPGGRDEVGEACAGHREAIHPEAVDRDAMRRGGHQRRSAVTDRPDPAVTYERYLQVDALLSLQQPRSDPAEHDELLFIVIHQVYELWFKELLHELDRVVTLLRRDEPHRSQHTLKRILTILKVLVAQLDILEMMTPLEFLSFRARLEAASGFQSSQFRELEFILGVKSVAAVQRFPAGSRGRLALERRLPEPTIWD